MQSKMHFWNISTWIRIFEWRISLRTRPMCALVRPASCICMANMIRLNCRLPVATEYIDGSLSWMTSLLSFDLTIFQLFVDTTAATPHNQNIRLKNTNCNWFSWLRSNAIWFQYLPHFCYCCIDCDQTQPFTRKRLCASTREDKISLHFVNNEQLVSHQIIIKWTILCLFREQAETEWMMVLRMASKSRISHLNLCRS